jgi:hypothetical protein
MLPRTKAGKCALHCHHERAQQAALLAGRSMRLDIRVVTTALSVRSVALQSCERKRSVEVIKLLLQKAVVADASVNEGVMDAKSL